MMSTICDLPAIDVHGHYGQYVCSETHPLKQRFMCGEPAAVAARAKATHIRYTVVSPLRALFPRGQADAVAGNEEAQRVVEETEGLLQWVVLHPHQLATFEQVREMLKKQPKCMGIKIHPEEHGYSIAKHGRAIFEFAAELRTVILAHSGEPNSLPADFVPFANDFPEATLILAHLGNSGAAGDSVELQVRAIQASLHGNVYADTSSAQSLLPGLIEWAVGEVGAERILFGTDTPLYFSPSQRARIDHADLNDEQKCWILRDNARRILPIPDDTFSTKERNRC
ncbi:MAG: amidohydrolase family protein [Pirellulales bacterium]|nr:amidohydrolase family protein [Pirellulales bacterium]